MSRALFPLSAACLLVGGILLSGCTTTDGRPAMPGVLTMSAAWTDDGQHMNVVLRNVGGTSMSLSGMNMTMMGPDGAILPIHWNGMAPMLDPGKSVSFELHSMIMADGTMGMTMDHAMAGDHMRMDPGDYMVRMGSANTHAMLGG